MQPEGPMSRLRYSVRPRPEKRSIPFDDAAQAWFWFMRCTRARVDGARFDETATDRSRPCDPDDLYRIVMELRRRRLLSDAHLKVLADYGWREVPPDPRVREEERAVRLWDEAMDHLTTPLTGRGIVFHEHDDLPA